MPPGPLQTGAVAVFMPSTRFCRSPRSSPGGADPGARGPGSRPRVGRRRALTAVVIVMGGSILFPPPVSAQLQDAAHAHVDVGLGSWSGALSWLGSIGAGLSSPWVGVTVSPAAVLVRGKEGVRRYVSEQVAVGETVCLDRRTRTPYPDVVCTVANSSFTWAPSAEVHLSAQSLGLPVWLGVGLRRGTAEPLTWSLSYFVHRSEDVGRIRIRASYSRDAWHIGLGALAGGG